MTNKPPEAFLSSSFSCLRSIKRYRFSNSENDLSFTLTGNRMTALLDSIATGTEAGDKSFTTTPTGAEKFWRIVQKPAIGYH